MWWLCHDLLLLPFQIHDSSTFFNFHSAHATGKHSQFKTDNFLHTVYWIPPYWDTLVYIRIAMILPRRNITCSYGGSQNSVGEVEKTRLRLPGTSVMSLSSPAHLRLLIAALAILMLPWSPPLTAFEGCASTQAFGRQTSNLHPKANKSKLFKGEVPKILKIPPLQRRGKVFFVAILDRHWRFVSPSLQPACYHNTHGLFPTLICWHLEPGVWQCASVMLTVVNKDCTPHLPPTELQNDPSWYKKQGCLAKEPHLAQQQQKIPPGRVKVYLIDPRIWISGNVCWVLSENGASEAVF